MEWVIINTKDVITIDFPENKNSKGICRCLIKEPIREIFNASI